ncbi:MAG: DUF308 domain-containing protein [Treponema sp.]|nr:DUF308 domain-containing protein [Treponema sp.]
MRLKSLILGIIVFVLGLLTTIMPQKIFNATIIITGIALIADGIYSIIKTTKDIANPETRKPLIIRSILCIIIGSVDVACPVIFKNAIDTVCMILGFVLAVFLIANAAFGFFTAGRIANDDKKKKALTSESLICLLIAIILFILPIKSITETITRISGIITLLLGLAIVGYEVLLYVLHKKDNVQVIDVSDDDEKTDDSQTAQESTDETTSEGIVDSENKDISDNENKLNNN